jgi:hypothetical protein
MSHQPPPITVDEDRFLKLKPKALAWLIGIVIVIAGSWITIKYDMVTLRRDVTEHSEALKQFSAQLQAIESDARTAREVTAKLDRNMGEAALKAQFNQELVSQKLDQIMAEKRGGRSSP